MKVDLLYHMEDTQVRLEQIRAFIILLMQEYMTEKKLGELTKQDKELIEVNMVTLFEMVHDLKAELGKHIDEAYKAEG